MYRTDAGLPLYRWELLEQYADKVEAGITTRLGGFSAGPYAAFNQALHCGDDREAVVGNRRLLCRALSVPFGSYTCAEQIHGCETALAGEDQKGAGREEYSDSLGGTDALIVREKGIFINIHLADCAPVVLYDPVRETGALVHCGWKGTAALAALKTVRRMKEELGSDPGDLIAGIGPSIGSCCFEIGADTAEALGRSSEYPGRVIAEEKGRYWADLKEANRLQLISAGLRGENIEVSEICTSCSTEEFYSHRAEKGKTGRFAAFLMLK